MRSIVLLAGFFALLGTGITLAQGDKSPSIKDVMGKLNKGPNSLCPTLGKELKDDEPAWAEMQKQTKEFVTFAEALGKNSPPKGEKDSWTKLTGTYLASAKELDTAVQKQDKSAAASAHKKLAGSCMSCHKAHK